MRHDDEQYRRSDNCGRMKDVGCEGASFHKSRARNDHKDDHKDRAAKRRDKAARNKRLPRQTAAVNTTL